MMWGLDQKLKDHKAMIDANIDSKIAGVSEHLRKLDTDLHVHKSEFQEHKRVSDAWSVAMTASQQKTEISQENTEKNVECIKRILETYLPNLKDAEEKRATKHQIKEGALWLSAIAGALIVVIGLMASIWAYLSGYLNSLVSN